MKIILHRLNKLDNQKDKLELSDGFECDIRYKNNLPVLAHDINETSEALNFETLCGPFKKLDVILNFKETGEEDIFIEKYQKFFNSILILDSPFPMFQKLAKKGLGGSLMWRVSEYEKPSIKRIEEFNSKWIWLDSFNEYWFTVDDLRKYKNAGLKICLVSNELQGRKIDHKIKNIIELNQFSMIDAICTKEPNFYVQILLG